MNNPVNGSHPLLGQPPLLLLRQRPVGVDLPAQQDYFGVASDKSCSVFCNHCCPLDNVTVEGFKSICNTAAGSGAGCGLRTVSGGSAFGVCAQPLSNSKISASDGIAYRLGCGESIAILLGGGGVGGFLARRDGFVCAGGLGALEAGLRVLGVYVRNLCVVAPSLHLPGQHTGQDGTTDGGCSMGINHRQALHQNQNMASRMGFMTALFRKVGVRLHGV